MLRAIQQSLTIMDSNSIYIYATMAISQKHTQVLTCKDHNTSSTIKVLYLQKYLIKIGSVDTTSQRRSESSCY